MNTKELNERAEEVRKREKVEYKRMAFAYFNARTDDFEWKLFARDKAERDYQGAETTQRILDEALILLGEKGKMKCIAPGNYFPMQSDSNMAPTNSNGLEYYFTSEEDAIAYAKAMLAPEESSVVICRANRII